MTDPNRQQEYMARNPEAWQVRDEMDRQELNNAARQNEARDRLANLRLVHAEECAEIEDDAFEAMDDEGLLVLTGCFPVLSAKGRRQLDELDGWFSK